MKRILISLIIALSIVLTLTSCEEQSKDNGSSQKQEDTYHLYAFTENTKFFLYDYGYTYRNGNDIRIEEYHFDKDGNLVFPPIFKDYECTKVFKSLDELFGSAYFYLKANEGTFLFICMD